MTVGELRVALTDVPDDVQVQIGFVEEVCTDEAREEYDIDAAVGSTYYDALEGTFTMREQE